MSAKQELARQTTEEELRMDMSPMIDLVFLLLIFFMVSSHLIIVTIDKEVEPPIATNAQVAENNVGRILINIHSNGRIYGPGNGDDQIEFQTDDAITAFVDAERLKANEGGQKPTLHVRADRNVDTEYIKKVVQAAAEAQVNEVIFGSYVVDSNN